MRRMGYLGPLVCKCLKPTGEHPLAPDGWPRRPRGEASQRCCRRGRRALAWVQAQALGGDPSERGARHLFAAGPCLRPFRAWKHGGQPTEAPGSMPMPLRGLTSRHRIYDEEEICARVRRHFLQHELRSYEVIQKTRAAL